MSARGSARAVLLVTLVACQAQPVAPETPSVPPNIVYILADDLGYGDLSAMNENAAWVTPHLDRMAAQGMLFSDAHSGSAVCTPTRYGILTGRYAWRTQLAKGVLGGDSPALIDAQRVTIGSWLQDAGYHTACIGKWHLGWEWTRIDGPEREIDFAGPVSAGPHERGFDETFCHSGSLDMAPYVWVRNGRVTALPDRVTENKDHQGFWRKGPTGADFVHDDVLPEVTRRAVEYLNERSDSDQPFFLYLPFPAPHTPILPTEEFRGASGTNVYGDFVLQVDDCVGQILAALDANGLAHNTLVVFTSDNGCSPRAGFEELARFGHHPSRELRGSKADIFEGGHRVPFLVRWPGRVRAGSQSSETICLTDMLSTCAEILERELPPGAAPDSVSFLPALLEQPAARERPALIQHSINGSFAVRDGRWKLILCPGSGGWSEPRPKLAREQGLPGWQLYDLQADIGETRNVARENPEVCARLVAVLDDFIERGRSTPGAALVNDRDVRYLAAGSLWE